MMLGSYLRESFWGFSATRDEEEGSLEKGGRRKPAPRARLQKVAKKGEGQARGSLSSAASRFPGR